MVRGATLRGLEGVIPRIKKARRHYGFSLSTDFERGVDPEAKSFISDYDGRKLCSDRMFWLINKVGFSVLAYSDNKDFILAYLFTRAIQSLMIQSELNVSFVNIHLEFFLLRKPNYIHQH